jgi:DHA1 family bicyclomycin/chloramphenicol resistance-like MFS transporter
VTTKRIAHGSRDYYRLGAILGALTAMGPLAIDLYLPSFPSIARDLGSTVSAVEVTAATYFIGLSFGQAIYGPITDRIGRKIPLYAGLIIFILASIGCAFATSVPALVGLRFLQALGGCAEMVVARAMVRDLFEDHDAIRILSLLLLVMGLAPILAPLIGGQLLVHFGWRSVFLALASYAAVCLVAVSRTLPESLAVEHRRRESLWTILGIYRTLLGDRRYMTYVLTGGLVISGMFAYIAGSPFVFIELFHVPADRFGFFFGANALGLITASQINGRLARRTNPRTILAVVLPATALASVALLVNSATGFGGFPGILLPLFVCVASVGFVLPNTTVLAMSPHGRIAGSASALMGMFQFLLGAIAGALVSVLSNGTSIPLGMVIAGCGVGALVIHRASPMVEPAVVAARSEA